jgi:hypothetical protein
MCVHVSYERASRLLALALGSGSCNEAAVRAMESKQAIIRRRVSSLMAATKAEAEAAEGGTATDDAGDAAAAAVLLYDRLLEGLLADAEDWASSELSTDGGEEESPAAMALAERVERRAMLQVGDGPNLMPGSQSCGHQHQLVVGRWRARRCGARGAGAAAPPPPPALPRRAGRRTLIVPALRSRRSRW